MSALVELPTTPRRTFASFFSASKPTFSNIHPDTVSNPMIDESMEKSEAMITKWDVQASSLAKFTSLFHGESRKEANEFITCVKDLRHAMHFLVSEGSRTSAKLVQAQNLMTMSMKRLEKEFYQILSYNRAYLDPESVSSRSSPFSGTTPSTSNYETSDYSSDYEIQTVGEDENHDNMTEADRLSALAMSDLRMIADCMISVGYSKECLNIYKLIRKSIVDEWFYKHGIERYSSSQITKMNATSLEGQMNTWLSAVKDAVRTLLHGERLLCDHVFWSSGAIRESCFTNIAKEGATNLFRFPEFAAKSKRWPEKIFRLMEMHAALSDMLPDIESMFSYESFASIKTQIFSSVQKLADSVQTILTEFESSVQKNSSKIIYHGGAIHPLTISVMEYVSKLASYSGTLSGIIGDSTLPNMPFPESYFSSPVTSDNQTSAASNRVAWIILVLLCKLDTKSVYYNDTALTYLFLSNNLLFILQIVQTTALQHLLGDDWMTNLERKIKVYAAKYELTSWGKVVACLPENLHEEMTTDTAKAYFRQFISTFDEAYQKQKSWVVPDGKFREDIKISITRKLVPAYREFYNRHIQVLKVQRSADLLLRFSPDNLGNYLSDILHGTGDVSESSPSPSSTSRASKWLA